MPKLTKLRVEKLPVKPTAYFVWDDEVVGHFAHEVRDVDLQARREELLTLIAALSVNLA